MSRLFLSAKILRTDTAAQVEADRQRLSSACSVDVKDFQSYAAEARDL
jgi:hypothetical protein